MKAHLLYLIFPSNWTYKVVYFSIKYKVGVPLIRGHPPTGLKIFCLLLATPVQTGLIIIDRVILCFYRGQRMLEEFESHLTDAKQKCSESEEKADRTSKLLAKVKNGVEHLSEKLQHMKAVRLLLVT